jgi:hypothetical protein
MARAALRVAALLVTIAGTQGAHGAGADLTPFLGVWTFRGGAQLQAQCGLVRPPFTLEGVRASIYPGTTTDIVIDIGCRCVLGLNVTGTHAALAGAQSCLTMGRGFQIDGTVDALTLDRTDDGTLTFTLAGDQAQLTSIDFECALTALSGTGTLARTGQVAIDGDGAITCGAPETAVGIIPTSGAGASDCPLGAGREGLRIETHDEEGEHHCSASTGGQGEGRWLLPDDDRARTPVCKADPATVLYFCRVDGAKLHPLTTEADPSQYYAVLKLGSICPNGSIEVQKRIDNEDTPTGHPSRVIGDPGPNEVLSYPGTVTWLSFCYFRKATSAKDVMTSFPDYGIPYAVFHRFVGPQPPWVLMRRWQLSDDENNQVDDKNNQYDSVDDTVLPEFTEVIENPQMNTIYNFARVR